MQLEVRLLNLRSEWSWGHSRYAEKAEVGGRRVRVFRVGDWGHDEERPAGHAAHRQLVRVRRDDLGRLVAEFEDVAHETHLVPAYLPSGLSIRLSLEELLEDGDRV